MASNLLMMNFCLLKTLPPLSDIANVNKVYLLIKVKDHSKISLESLARFHDDESM